MSGRETRCERLSSGGGAGLPLFPMMLVVVEEPVWLLASSAAAYVFPLARVEEGRSLLMYTAGLVQIEDGSHSLSGSRLAACLFAPGRLVSARGQLREVREGWKCATKL